MQTASSSEQPSGAPVLLFRPIDVAQLANALGKKPLRVIADLMELDRFVSLRSEIEDDCLADYARSQGFDYRILDRR